jgi:hypothetical protein
MIKINKRPLPGDVTITCEEDYRSGKVFQMLIEDCHDKCYICEDSVHTAPNVEHRIPGNRDSALKYDWNNLLLACSHCNNTKSDRFDEIIDPTVIDPEEFIALSLSVDDELREVVIVHKIKDCANVDTTINLLDAVYNGIRTDMRRYACQQLKNKLSNELLWFRQKIDEYKKCSNTDIKTTIDCMISDKSVFAAFKRKIVRDEPELSQSFVAQEQ